MAFPVFDLDLCPPGEMDAPSIRGGAVEGGRTLSGIVNAQSLAGGGLVTVAYRNIGLGNLDPARQRYWSRLAAVLNSGARSVLVPLLNDFTVPGGFGAAFGVNAPAGAGTITLTLTGLRPGDAPLSGGEWFGVYPADGRLRAHVITDIDAAQVNPDGTASYVVGIAPPLRAAQSATNGVNFVRPSCLMRLAPGTAIKTTVQPGWWTTPDVEFVESFGYS